MTRRLVVAASLVLSGAIFLTPAYSSQAPAAGIDSGTAHPQSGGAYAGRNDAKPDLIFINGNVLTMDPNGGVAEAVAVAGERIVAVGTTAAIKGMAGQTARIIDLAGKTLLPGFIDSRLHGPLGFWELEVGASLTDKDGRPLGRPEEIEARLKSWKAEHPPAPYAWVVAAGFDPKMSASRKFDRDWADQMIADNPLLLLSLDHHVALLNSRAIELVGLQGVAVPEGSGEIVRDARGRPSGLVREVPVFLVLNRIWALLPEEVRRDATVRFLDAAGRFGITTIGDPLMVPADLALDESLLRDKALPVRIVAGTLREDAASNAAFDDYRKGKRSPDPERLSVGPSLQILDGSLLGWGAALFQVYRDSAWTSGFMTMPPERIARLLADDAGDGGFLVEASGGLAVHLFLDAFDRLPAASRPAMLLRADGLQLVAPADRERLAGASKRGLIVSLQPTRFPYRLYIQDSLGAERAKEAMPYQALLHAGMTLAINSDWPMTAQTFQPTQIVEWSVTRAGFGAEEALSIPQALRAYTADAARALGLQDKVGSIEAGKKADFVVLDSNPIDLDSAPDRISDIRVRMTFSSGALVFEDRRVADGPHPPPIDRAAGGR